MEQPPPRIIGYTTNTTTTIITNNTPTVITNIYYSFASNTTFYDYREGKTVQAVQIDVGNLVAWITNDAADGGILLIFKIGYTKAMELTAFTSTVVCL